MPSSDTGLYSHATWAVQTRLSPGSSPTAAQLPQNTGTAAVKGDPQQKRQSHLVWACRTEESPQLPRHTDGRTALGNGPAQAASARLAPSKARPTARACSEPTTGGPGPAAGNLPKARLPSLESLAEGSRALGRFPAGGPGPPVAGSLQARAVGPALPGASLAEAGPLPSAVLPSVCRGS